ncbi:type VI secretion system tip protein VgrG [Cronobacter sakazakii]|nr:type VI secretion system tip protein VgrG [Cronobacter sakazakii]
MNTDNGGKPQESLSRYGLVIHNSDITPDVLRFRGREALSEPFFWNIEFTTPQAGLLPEQVLMKYASLRMRGGRTIYGILTRLEWLSTTADQSHYSVTLSSRLALLSHTRQCRVFLNQSVPEVVEQVLREHGLEGADFDFRLEREYPERELITQWRETDLEFIQRLLSEVGIWWRTEMDSLRGLDVTIFADTQLNYHFDVRLPYREPSGLNDGAQEAVWGVRTWHNAVTGRVQTRDYYYPAATTPLDATVRIRSTAVTTGEHYRYAEPYREQGDDTDPEPESESGAFYARIHHERELNNSLRVHLFSNAGALTPGMVLEPQGDVIRALKEGVITATKNVAVSAGGDISVGVMGNMTALAGEKLGLFAHSGPLSLKSGEGPLEVQAQNGGMQLAAEKKVTLTSVSDISFAGKKRITLIGGGSYLKLEAGKIEYGTPQVYLRKVEKTYLGASKSRQVEFPYLPGKEGVYSRGFILLDDRTNEPAAGIAYRLTLSSGEKVENVSNNKGCTYIMSHKEKHEVELTILRQESLIIG